MINVGRSCLGNPAIYASNPSVWRLFNADSGISVLRCSRSINAALLDLVILRATLLVFCPCCTTYNCAGYCADISAIVLFSVIFIFCMTLLAYVVQSLCIVG